MPQLKAKTEPGRNELYPCKSELKFKWCHGDPAKRAVCEVAMRETMVKLIMQEKFKRGMITEEQLQMILDPAETEPLTEEEQQEFNIIRP